MKNLDNQTQSEKAIIAEAFIKDFEASFQGSEGNGIIEGLNTNYHNNNISPEYHLPGC